MDASYNLCGTTLTDVTLTAFSCPEYDENKTLDTLTIAPNQTVVLTVTNVFSGSNGRISPEIIVGPTFYLHGYPMRVH